MYERDSREEAAALSPEAAADSALHGSSGGEREVLAPLDGRQIFFLFIGSAVCACLIFAAGVVIGRRVERRAAAAAQTAIVTDPLAVLDEIANAEEALTFHRALLDRPSARPRNEASSESELSPTAPPHGKTFGPPRPRFTLLSATLATKPEAETLIRRLREAGYRPTLIDGAAAHKPGQYRIQIGDFPSPEIAQPLKSELLTRYQLRAAIMPL